MDHSSHLSKERLDNGSTTIIRLLNKQLPDTLVQLEPLLSRHSRSSMDTTHKLKAAREIGESATVDVLQVLSVSIENELWFLEAYLEAIVVGLHGRKLPVWTSTLSDQRRTE